tara:strand:+ start:4308 stop:4991 length:684 start_codon:yes stop_codon:yes gene_type:complete
MNKFLIRSFDIILSSIALIVLSPLLLPIILILRLTAEGEVFYRQQRVGMYGKSFGLIKFATMLKNSENMGTKTLTIKGDSRILPFGHFLRKTKINELPQLFNIFIGNMSVIGPRPQTEESFNYFPEEHKKNLILMKPGLSGIGSIIFSNEEFMLDGKEDPIDFYRTSIAPYKADLEIWYLNEKNKVFLYIFFIFATIVAVIGVKKTYLYKLFDSMPRVPEKLKNYIY